MSDDQLKRMSEDDEYESETDEFGDEMDDGFEEEEEVTISVTSDDDEDHPGSESIELSAPVLEGGTQPAKVAAPRPRPRPRRLCPENPPKNPRP
jgi:hypothetical protein